ncbi:hypothetical protein LINGRAPRIM_LOCUS1785 [Linum grandiflorum]
MLGARSNAQRRCVYTATSAYCVSFAMNDSRVSALSVVSWVIPTNTVKHTSTSRPIRSYANGTTQSGFNLAISSSRWRPSG